MFVSVSEGLPLAEISRVISSRVQSSDDSCSDSCELRAITLTSGCTGGFRRVASAVWRKHLDEAEAHLLERKLVAARTLPRCGSEMPVNPSPRRSTYDINVDTAEFGDNDGPELLTAARILPLGKQEGGEPVPGAAIAGRSGWHPASPGAVIGRERSLSRALLRESPIRQGSFRVPWDDRNVVPSGEST
jgi:hypothetical protein